MKETILLEIRTKEENFRTSTFKLGLVEDWSKGTVYISPIEIDYENIAWYEEAYETWIVDYGFELVEESTSDLGPLYAIAQGRNENGEVLIYWEWSDKNKLNTICTDEEYRQKGYTEEEIPLIKKYEELENKYKTTGITRKEEQEFDELQAKLTI